MIIRKVRFEDYEEIRDLAEKFNINVYSKNNWEDIWKKNPCLKNENKNWTIGWVLENNNKIVGHLGNIPTEYIYNQKKYIGSVISCWVVEPEYRLHSIRLIKEYHAQSGIDFFLATTSNFKTAKALKAFGWQNMPHEEYDNKLNIIINFEYVYNSYILRRFKKNNIFFKIIYKCLSLFLYKKINYWKKFETNKKFEIYKKFDDKFDEFWEKIKTENRSKFLFNRSSEWVNWHLNNKIQENESLILALKENKKIVGYAICVNKYDSRVNMKKAVLVDLMLLEKKEQFSLDLILSCLEESRKSNCHLFQMVGFDDKKRKFMYKLSPFSRKNKFSPYLFKSENLELIDLLQNKDSWYPNELEGDSIF